MTPQHQWKSSHWQTVSAIAESILLLGFDGSTDAVTGRLDNRLRRIRHLARSADGFGAGVDDPRHDDLIVELASFERLQSSGQGAGQSEPVDQDPRPFLAGLPALPLLGGQQNDVETWTACSDRTRQGRR